MTSKTLTMTVTPAAPTGWSTTLETRWQRLIRRVLRRRRPTALIYPDGARPVTFDLTGSDGIARRIHIPHAIVTTEESP